MDLVPLDVGVVDIREELDPMRPRIADRVVAERDPARVPGADHSRRPVQALPRSRHADGLDELGDVQSMVGGAGPVRAFKRDTLKLDVLDRIFHRPAQGNQGGDTGNRHAQRVGLNSFRDA